MANEFRESLIAGWVLGIDPRPFTMKRFARIQSMMTGRWVPGADDGFPPQWEPSGFDPKKIQEVADTLPKREIPNETGDVYLERYLISGWSPQTPGEYPFSTYLHRFLRADAELPHVLHNHPWEWGFSLVLAGGYVEERRGAGGAPKIRNLYPGDINEIEADTFHKVNALLGPSVWTLFVVGPKRQGWGFDVPGRGFVHWRDRLKERGIPLPY